jgi:lysophospholipase L1-like esterase
MLAVQVTPTSGTWRLTAYPAAYSNVVSGTGNLAAVEAPTGADAIAFGELTGYRKPLPQTNFIGLNQQITFTGLYLRVGAIAVQVSPSNGTWRLTACPATYTNALSGTGSLAAVEAPTGTYVATFGGLTGYRAPNPQTNAVVSNELVTFAGRYDRNRAPLDYDGDRKTDPAVFDYSDGYWYILLSSNFNVLSGQLGWDETRPVIGDFDGDGKTDPAVFHRETGFWYIFQSSNSTMLSGQLSWGEARPVPGDYDGDRKTDAGVFDYETGIWYIFLSASQRVWTGQFGLGNDRPIPEDYDGDRRTDPAFYERDSGTWFVYLSSTSNAVSCSFGRNDARPVPADYNGDGCAEVAMYYRAFGLWYIMQTNGVMASFQFGWAGANPAPGDYDGDGCVDAAVFDRSNATWYARSSLNSNTLSGQWGLPDNCSLPSYANGAIEGLLILAFGDSITYGGGSSSDGPATGYPILLERILEPAFGGHFAVINAGNPGETTEEALHRFEATLIEADPDVLLLMEGTNDEFYGDPYDQTEDNLRYMVLTAQRHGVQVIIATIPPVISNAYRERSDQQARIQGFNPRIYQIAADCGIPVARVYEAITAVPGWESKLIHQPSANHPNDAGYLVVRDTFFAAIAAAINSGLFY